MGRLDGSELQLAGRYSEVEMSGSGEIVDDFDLTLVAVFLGHMSIICRSSWKSWKDQDEFWNIWLACLLMEARGRH